MPKPKHGKDSDYRMWPDGNQNCRYTVVTRLLSLAGTVPNDVAYMVNVQIMKDVTF